MLIKPGESGETVRQLQYALTILCCPPGSIDGQFGAGTDSAVRKFQEEWGLTPDGIVGDDTWNALRSEIKPIQSALKEKGYFSGVSTGIATKSLYEAIKDFQRASSVTPDGMVGSTTRALIFANNSEEAEGDIFPLDIGSKGDYVRFVQCGLYILCCNPSGIDGVYGSSTAEALKKFQGKYALSQTGVCNISTWDKMKEQILEIEEALDSRGYEFGGVDGIATTATIEQIKAFQETNWLTPDGQVGPSTRAILISDIPDGATDAFPLKKGSRGPNVLHLQYGLRICCINPNGTDGVFGAGTESAVKRFQASKNFTQDGTVNAQTWDTLCEDIKPIQRALRDLSYINCGIDGVATQEVYDAVTQYQEDHQLTPDGMVGSSTRMLLLGEGDGKGTVSSTLRLGSNGSLTLYLQRLLIELGYSSVTKNGIFDEATKAAVIDFQTENKLDPDGVVGGGTWRVLFEKYHINPTGSPVKKLLDVAYHELDWGFAEDNANNITPYGQWYGMNGSAWCAMFVSYCAYQAGVMETLVPRYSWCESGASWYRTRGRYHKKSEGYIPKEGDIVFFYNYNLGRIAHTGIVAGGDRTTLITIEGNTAQERVETVTRNLNSTEIDGYGENYGTPIYEEPLADRELARRVQREIHNITGTPMFGAEVEAEKPYEIGIGDYMKFVGAFGSKQSLLEGQIMQQVQIVDGEASLGFDLSDKVSLGFEGVESADIGIEAALELFSYEDTQYGIPNTGTCTIKAIAETEGEEVWVGFGYEFERKFSYQGRNVTLYNSYAILVKRTNGSQTSEEIATAVQVAKMYDWVVAHPNAIENGLRIAMGVCILSAGALIMNYFGVTTLVAVFTYLAAALTKFFSHFLGFLG